MEKHPVEDTLMRSKDTFYGPPYRITHQILQSHMRSTLPYRILLGMVCIEFVDNDYDCSTKKHEVGKQTHSHH
jgi:hypothetical protein